MSRPTNQELYREALEAFISDAPPASVAVFLRTNSKILRPKLRLDPVGYHTLIEQSAAPDSRHYGEARGYLTKVMGAGFFKKIPLGKLKLNKALNHEMLGIELEDLKARIDHARAGFFSSVFLEFPNPLKVAHYATSYFSNNVAAAMNHFGKMNQSQRHGALIGFTKPYVAAAAFVFYSQFNGAADAAVMDSHRPELPPIISTRLLNRKKGVDDITTASFSQPATSGSPLAYNEGQSQSAAQKAISEAFMNSLPSVAPQLDSPSIQDSPNAAYEPLLALIEMGESTIGGYNAVYLPYAKANQNINLDLTKMSVNEVRALQDKMVAEGFDSTALGRYQIIRDTMDYLIKKMNLTGNELYDARIQDDMAITLLRRRGVDSYLSGTLPLNKFITRMSKEWASFPEGPNNQSYYKGVGNNVAHLTYKQIKSGLLESMALAEKQGLQTTRFGGKMASITTIPIPTARPHTPSGS